MLQCSVALLIAIDNSLFNFEYFPLALLSSFPGGGDICSEKLTASLLSLLFVALAGVNVFRAAFFSITTALLGHTVFENNSGRTTSSVSLGALG